MTTKRILPLAIGIGSAPTNRFRRLQALVFDPLAGFVSTETILEDRHPQHLLDGWAAEQVRRVARIRFGVAQTSSECEAVHRLRYRIAIERGWAKPEDFPDGLERDMEDDRAVLIAGWEGEKIVATSRLVLPRPGRSLPTERTFGLTILPRGRITDLGRVCVEPVTREDNHHVLLALLGQTWLEMRQRGFTEACATLTGSIARVCRRIGLNVTMHGPPKFYWGERRYLGLIQPSGSVDPLIKSEIRKRPRHS